MTEAESLFVYGNAFHQIQKDCEGTITKTLLDPTKVEVSRDYPSVPTFRFKPNTNYWFGAGYPMEKCKTWVDDMVNFPITDLPEISKPPISTSTKEILKEPNNYKFGTTEFIIKFSKEEVNSNSNIWKFGQVEYIGKPLNGMSRSKTPTYNEHSMDAHKYFMEANRKERRAWIGNPTKIPIQVSKEEMPTFNIHGLPIEVGDMVTIQDMVGKINTSSEYIATAVNQNTMSIKPTSTYSMGCRIAPPDILYKSDEVFTPYSDMPKTKIIEDNMMKDLAEMMDSISTGAPYRENIELQSLMFTAIEKALICPSKYRSVIQDSLGENRTFGRTFRYNKSMDGSSKIDSLTNLGENLYEASKISGTKGSSWILNPNPVCGNISSDWNKDIPVYQDWIFLDYDFGNVYSWVQTIFMLEESGLGYIIQESHSSTFEHTVGSKFHVIIPLSIPLSTRKNYAREYCWILGILGGAISDTCIFDYRTNIQNQPIFCPLKDSKSLRTAEIRYKEGKTLDWEKLLKYTGFHLQAQKSDPVVDDIAF